MNKRIIFAFAVLASLCFSSCAKLINGDIDETVDEHFKNDDDYYYQYDDSGDYVYNWTYGTIENGSDGVLYRFWADYGITYKVFLKNSRYEYGYADVMMTARTDGNSDWYFMDISDSYYNNVQTIYPNYSGWVNILIEPADDSESYSGQFNNFEIAVVYGNAPNYSSMYLE